MAGTVKRAHAADSSDAGNEEAPASKQPRTDLANWCVHCWGPSEDACRGGHRLLDRTAAERELQEQFTAVRMELTKLQARLDVLAKARLREGLVLLGIVGDSDGSFDGWIVPGGDVRIALATKSLTIEDKAKITEALGGVEMDYDVDGNESVMAYCDVESYLDGLMDKFPDLVVGQEVRDGDVLLNSKRQRVEVYFRGAQVKEVGFKQFGIVKEGLKALQAEGCPSDGYSYGSRKEECCSGGEEECFCVTRRPGSAILEDVKFEVESKVEDKNEKESDKGEIGDDDGED